MLNKIKKNIDLELIKFIKKIDKKYNLSHISPLLHKSLINFLQRKGKRIRPLLFIMGYKGFSDKHPRNLCTSALAIELLHCFLLIHDDIIDNAAIRRGKPSMHILLNKSFDSKIRAESRGTPLALVIGDIIYALSIEAFTAIEESPKKKQQALLKFLESGFYTGCGEFIEIINSKKPISQISSKEIYKTYDLKTAYYTFSAPLITGAILAGANKAEIRKLSSFGKYCGRAFQIKDDMLGIFGNISQTGKSSITDIKENKKTLLIWHACKNADNADLARIQRIFKKTEINNSDIIYMRKLLNKTGSLNYCLKQIENLSQKAVKSLAKSNLKNTYKKELIKYCCQLLEFKMHA